MFVFYLSGLDKAFLILYRICYTPGNFDVGIRIRCRIKFLKFPLVPIVLPGIQCSKLYKGFQKVWSFGLKKECLYEITVKNLL